MCESTLDAARRGKVVICISALSLIEVIKLGKGHSALPREHEDRIVRFFDNSFIEIYDVDHWIGSLARDLIWKNALDPKDAIHVATAINNDIPELHTFDGKLLALDNRLPLKSGTGNLRICQPPPQNQNSLFKAEEK